MKDFMESIEKSLYEKDLEIERSQLHSLQVNFEDEYNSKLFPAMMKAIDQHQKKKSKLFDEPGDHSVLVSGSNLPSKILKAKKKTSLISDYYIRGYPYVLEDGKTFINNNEAMEWATIYTFSPLLNGSLMNPF